MQQRLIKPLAPLQRKSSPAQRLTLAMQSAWARLSTPANQTANDAVHTAALVIGTAIAEVQAPARAVAARAPQPAAAVVNGNARTGTTASASGSIATTAVIAVVMMAATDMLATTRIAMPLTGTAPMRVVTRCETASMEAVTAVTRMGTAGTITATGIARSGRSATPMPAARLLAATVLGRLKRQPKLLPAPQRLR